MRWVTDAHELRADGSTVTLHDADGDVVATLTPVPRPTGTDFELHDEIFGSRPLSLADDPAPLPDGLRPAERAELLGKWLPVLRKGQPRPTMGEAYLRLKAGGTATGSDGCNGAGGTWRYRDGALLVVGGASTLIGCDNVDVGSWLHDARRAGFDGDTLVLVDTAGEELGRLRRA